MLDLEQSKQQVQLTAAERVKWEWRDANVKDWADRTYQHEIKVLSVAVERRRLWV